MRTLARIHRHTPKRNDLEDVAVSRNKPVFVDENSAPRFVCAKTSIYKRPWEKCYVKCSP